MENLIQFVPQDLLILVASTYVVGLVLKGSNFVKDKYINLFLMIFGIAGAMSMTGFTTLAFMQGIIIAGVATLINQTTKQLTREDK